MYVAQPQGANYIPEEYFRLKHIQFYIDKFLNIL